MVQVSLRQIIATPICNTNKHLLMPNKGKAPMPTPNKYTWVEIHRVQQHIMRKLLKENAFQRNNLIKMVLYWISNQDLPHFSFSNSYFSTHNKLPKNRCKGTNNYSIKTVFQKLFWCYPNIPIFIVSVFTDWLLASLLLLEINIALIKISSYFIVR